MTDTTPVPPTVHVVVDHRGANPDPELTAYASDQAAHAAVGVAALIGQGLRPGDVTVHPLAVRGMPAAPPAEAQLSTVQCPTWIRDTVRLACYDNAIRLTTGDHLAHVSASTWTSERDEEFAQYVVDLVNADLATRQ